MEKEPTVSEILAEIDSDVELMREQAAIARAFHANQVNFRALEAQLQKENSANVASPEAQELFKKFADDALLNIP